MAINGSDVVLLVNTGTEETPSYEIAGCQRGVTFTETVEEIDVSSKCDRAKRVLPGRYSASITLDALYIPDEDAYAALRNSMIDGDLILVARQEEEVTIATASAVVTNMSETFPDQGEGTISISLSIDGFWEVVGS